MANRVKTWSTEVLTDTDLNAEFDNIYAGSIDRTAGRWGNNDTIPVAFGSSQDCTITYNTTQTNDALVIGLGSDSRSIIICEEADKGTNFAIAQQTNPTLYVHSADATTAADYIYCTHDQTDGEIGTGAGGLNLKPTTEVVDIPDADRGDGNEGCCLKIGRNSNGSNAGAGFIALCDKGGTDYYIWVDDTGDLRIDTSVPTTANDTGGTIVGTQS